MNVDIAIVGVMMMLPCTHRSRDVVHRMCHRRSRRHAEREGRDQEHQASKEAAQNQHGVGIMSHYRIGKPSGEKQIRTRRKLPTDRS